MNKKIHSLVKRGKMLLNKKYKVLVVHPEVPAAGLQLLESSGCELVKVESLPPKRLEILEKAKDVDAFYWATHEPLNAEALDAAGSSLKAVSVMSAGVDYVDIEEFKKRKIPLGHTPNVLNNAVADLAIGLMIAAARRFHEGRRKIETLSWENERLNWMWGKDISKAVVGFFGFGGIGRKIAQRLRGFEIQEILYCTRNRVSTDIELEFNATHASLSDLLQKSDIVFIVAPLKQETANIFNSDAFKKMKNSAVLINVARGGIVCQKDLYTALKTNEIFAAGLDVMTPEPLPIDDPLLTLPNCIILPHIGSATERTRTEMSMVAAQNILNALNGEPMLTPVY